MTEQTQPKYLKLTPEEEAKVQRSRERSEATKLLIDREDLVMAEIAYYLGWEALRDVVNDEIALDDAVTLMKCVKEIRKQHVQEMAIATRAGMSNVKGAFEKLMKPYTPTMRVQ